MTAFLPAVPPAVLLALPLSLLVLQPALALDPGTVKGTLKINGKEIPLKFAHAHLHDNAEGVLDRPKELRILLADREVAPDKLRGLAFIPVEDMARSGEVEGILLRVNPANPNNLHATFLAKPEKEGASLITMSRSVTGAKLFKAWSYNPQRVTGALDDKEDLAPADPDGVPPVHYSLQFSAPVFNEPKVTADLKGKAALASPQMAVQKAKAEALIRGDFAALKKLSTEKANKQAESFLGSGDPQVKAFAKQVGTELKKQIGQVRRVVVRGDRAVALFPDKSWTTFVKVGGQWKSDD